MPHPQIESVPQQGAKAEKRRELVLPPCASLMAIHADHLNRPRAPRGSLWDDLFGGTKPQGFTRHGSTAVVAIEGPIDQRGSWFYEGYDDVQARFAAALSDPETSGVMLQVNSPGGVVAGCFEAVRAMSAMKAASGKPVFVFADEAAYSAAYALATIADEIWLPPEGGVGSIGVIATYVDCSKMLEMAGVRYVIVTSGNEKADGHPALPVTDAAVGRLREDVTDLAKAFWGIVADARDISVEQVKALQAGTYMGAKAVDVKIADHVGSFKDAVAALEARAASNKSKSPGTRAQGDHMANKKLEEAGASVEPGALLISPDTIGAAEHQAVIAALRSENATAVAALQATIGEQKSAVDAANARASAAEAKLGTLDAQRLEAKVDGLVGVKITEAAKAKWLTLAKTSEAQFDALTADLPDLGLLGPPIVKGGDGVGARSGDTAAADRNVQRFHALVDEKVKAGMDRNDALSAVLASNPDLLEAM